MPNITINVSVSVSKPKPKVIHHHQNNVVVIGMPRNKDGSIDRRYTSPAILRKDGKRDLRTRY